MNRYSWFVATLCVLHFGLLLFASFHVSATSDEFPHLASGYAFVATGDLRMETEHPPLLKALAALPLLAFDLKLPLDHPSWQTGRHFDFYKELLFVYNKNADTLLFTARIPLMLVSVALLILVYVWSKEEFGERAGTLAAFLYAFEPNILGHAGLVMTDVGFALFALASSYALWKFVQKPSARHWIMFSIVFALAQLTKFTAVFLVPLVCLVLLVTSMLRPEPAYHRWLSRKIHALRKWPRLSTLVVHTALFALTGVVTLFAINAVYGFHGSFQTVHDAYMNDPNLDKQNFNIEVIENTHPVVKFVLRNVPNPLPYYYTKGFGYNVFWDAVKEWPRALFGEVRTSAFYSYYVLLLTFRLPIAFLVLLVVAAIAMHKGAKTARRKLLTVHLLLPALFFIVLFSVASRQGNIRYIIQIIPFLIVFASAINSTRWAQRTAGKAILAALCIAYLASSVAAYPDFLSYFNEFLPGDAVYTVFQDTNSQLGQHFYLVQKYVQDHPGTYGIFYPHRMDVMDFYNLKVYPLPAVCTPGKHIVDALSFYYTPERTKWLLNRDAIGRIGTTLYVYDVREC